MAPGVVTVEGPRYSRQEGEVVLLAVMGMSPAVLTETVWALVHANPPIVPHRVFVITTAPGARAIREVLFRQKGWQRLVGTLAAEGIDVDGRLIFGPATSCILPVPRPDASGDLDDITTEEHSVAAADLIMREVRKFTEDASTSLIGSVAGGRKTMGVLLAQCLSLLGRPCDRLCHVLVSPPYDSQQMEPLFLFPEPGVVHKLGSKTYRSTDARIDLTEIPFVPFRSLYERTFRRPPGSYMSLVRGLRGSVVSVPVPEVRVDWSTARIKVGEREVVLSLSEFAVWATVLWMLKAGRQIDCWKAVAEHMVEIRNGAPYRACFDKGEGPSGDDVRKAMGRVRNKLLDAGLEPEVVSRIAPALRSGINPIPPQKIRFVGARPS